MTRPALAANECTDDQEWAEALEIAARWKNEPRHSFGPNLCFGVLSRALLRAERILREEGLSPSYRYES
jgi:hypothetical protein